MRERNKRRGFKPVLPSAIIGNVRSLDSKNDSKMDELHAQVQYNSTFRTSSIMCFSETWLKEDVLDSCIDVDGFRLFRGDRERVREEIRWRCLCVCKQKVVSREQYVCKVQELFP